MNRLLKSDKLAQACARLSSIAIIYMACHMVKYLANACGQVARGIARVVSYRVY